MEIAQTQDIASTEISRTFDVNCNLDSLCDSKNVAPATKVISMRLLAPELSCSALLGQING